MSEEENLVGGWSWKGRAATQIVQSHMEISCQLSFSNHIQTASSSISFMANARRNAIDSGLPSLCFNYILVL